MRIYTEEEGRNHIFVSTYFQVSDTPVHGHNLWYGRGKVDEGNLEIKSK